MRNILYISYDGMTDNLGQSQVIPYLKGLSEKGYQFSILSFEKPENYKKNKHKISNMLMEAHINWIPLPYTSKPPVLSTIKDIWLLLKTAEQLHKKEQFNIVHCRSYISAFAGLKLKRKFGVRFVFDMRGFWADERVDGKIWSLKNPLFKLIYNFFKKKEQQFFNNCDYTISLTNEGKKEIHSWSPIVKNPIPIKVIPCCADFEHFKISESQTAQTKCLKEKFRIKEDDFVLSYLGSVGTWYMLDEMLDFFKVLLQTLPKAKFLFITSETKSMLLNAARSKNIPSHHFIIDSSTREMVPAYIALSNLSIFFIKPLYSKKASSPTKMAEIMGMGIPIICNDGVGDVSSIIQETGAGISLTELTTEAYKNAVQQIAELLQTDKLKIRQEAIQRFSLIKGVESYDTVYKEVL